MRFKMRGSRLTEPVSAVERAADDAVAARHRSEAIQGSRDSEAN